MTMGDTDFASHADDNRSYAAGNNIEEFIVKLQIVPKNTFEMVNWQPNESKPGQMLCQH